MTWAPARLHTTASTTPANKDDYHNLCLESLERPRGVRDGQAGEPDAEYRLEYGKDLPLDEGESQQGSRQRRRARPRRNYAS
jgi:hypothetical protein